MRKNSITILSILCASLLLVSCDCSGDDGTIGNWFLVIFLFLAIFK